MPLLTKLRKKRTGLLALAAGALFAGGFLTMPSAFAANPNDNGVGHTPVTICHHTGDKKDPYRVITPDASGVYDGHVDHQYQDDIIPPFQYINGQGQLIVFTGQNFGAEGAAIWANGCKIPTIPTTPPPCECTTPPATTPPATTPPATTPPATTPPATTPPATTTPATTPATTTSPAVVPQGSTTAPPQGQGPGAAQNPAPAASVAISAQTASSPTPADYTVPGLLFGSGALLALWLMLTLWTKRRRGEHV